MGRVGWSLDVRIEFARVALVACEEGFPCLCRYQLAPIRACINTCAARLGPNQSLYTCILTRQSRTRVSRGSELVSSISSFTLNRATFTQLYRAG